MAQALSLGLILTSKTELSQFSSSGVVRVVRSVDLRPRELSARRGKVAPGRIDSRRVAMMGTPGVRS